MDENVTGSRDMVLTDKATDFFSSDSPLSAILFSSPIFFIRPRRFSNRDFIDVLEFDRWSRRRNADWKSFDGDENSSVLNDEGAISITSYWSNMSLSNSRGLSFVDVVVVVFLLVLVAGDVANELDRDGITQKLLLTSRSITAEWCKYLFNEIMS